MFGIRKTAVVGLALVATIVGLTQLTSAAEGAAEPSLPFSETNYVLGDDIGSYASFMMSGGPPPDGIPSIDNPRFVAADAARLDPGEMVIGYAHGGQARAYPQRILVLHEIVNDRVGGLNVAITYCPLIWTTWERWRAAHPATEVLSERTGHLRNYNRDPYGSYNPLGGYYVQDRTMFPLMHSSSLHHQKEMVVGGRTAERSAYFVLNDLARERISATASFMAVYDPDLDTGYIYVRDGQNHDIEPLGDGRYEVDGQAYAPDALPLEQVVSVEAFFFAWNAFYPDSESP